MLRSHQVPVSSLTTGKTRISQLKAIARHNCKNDINNVNFNQYGKRDGLGFTPVNDYFIDSALIRKKMDKDQYSDKNEFMSVTTKQLNHKAEAAGLSKFGSFCCCATSENDTAMWKYACQSENPQIVLDFLQSIKAFGYNTHEIDITQDFAGSFDLDEIMTHFFDNHSLQVGYSKNNLFIEPEMQRNTGNTCFICKDPSSGNRQKIYLKFPQMLQSAKVREDLGNRWFDWTRTRYEKFTRSREASSIRGMSRVEISIPCSAADSVPTMEYLIDQLTNFTSRLPPSLSWATSHEDMWRSFADSFNHTLIVVDETYKESPSSKDIGLAIVVYGFHSLTKNIVGFTVKNWSKRAAQVMARFTLSSTLPIDLITITPTSRQLHNEWVEISGGRYRKEMKKGQEDLTYFTDKRGAFKFVKDMTTEKLSKDGFTSHKNIQPYIANKQFHIKSLVPATMILEDELDISLPDPSTFLKKEVYDKVMPMYNMSLPIKTDSIIPKEMDFPNNSLPLAEVDIQKIQGNSKVHSFPVIKLKSLPRGHYDIVYIFPMNGGKYPQFLINVSGTLYVMYSTDSLNGMLQGKTLPFSMCKSTDSSLFKLGTLHVDSHKRTLSHTYKSNVNITFL